MAQTMNQQYISTIRQTSANFPEPTTNPMETYNRYLGPNELSLTFQKVNMTQLKKTVSRMKSTRSATNDGVSMWAIKQANQELLPLILQLVNRVTTTGQFPETLKTSKVIPIENKTKTKQQ